MSRKSCVSGVFAFRYLPSLRSRNPSATSVSKKSQAARGMQAEPQSTGRTYGPRPSPAQVNRPSSIALSKVFDAQKARPVWRIRSGFG